MTDPLTAAVQTAHDGLVDRLAAAAGAAREHAPRHEIVQKSDDFCITACRHVAAMCDVALPGVRDEAASAYLVQVRRVEHTAARVKRHLYGEAHSAGMSWSSVWTSLEREVHALIDLERELVGAVSSRLSPDDCELLVERLRLAETLAPTRPHPWAPHRGPLAHLSRRLLARADRFWDAAEGRIVAS